MPIKEFSEWSITATADNLPATVQKAAEPGRVHYITSISGSFNNPAANGKLMTLKDGANIIGNYHVHGQTSPPLMEPIRLSPNSQAELSLAASGTLGQIGAVTMTGFTL